VAHNIYLVWFFDGISDHAQRTSSLAVYQRTKEQRDFWKERAELLEGMLDRIRQLPTYSVSQSTCIDSGAEKLLKTDDVYKIIGRPRGRLKVTE
jgi:hypothetical protein